ncbi:hypothetical protein QP222_09110, partial [Corynebacterium pyruviciproducens]|nr:hypothetical protein [Corynebacterium pyruviciproducens]
NPPSTDYAHPQYQLRRQPVPTTPISQLRPTTNTVSKKGLFRQKIKLCHRKSMLLAFYNVASFQGAEEKRRAFAQRLESVIDQEPDYKFGICYFGPSTKD